MTNNPSSQVDKPVLSTLSTWETRPGEPRVNPDETELYDHADKPVLSTLSSLSTWAKNDPCAHDVNQASPIGYHASVNVDRQLAEKCPSSVQVKATESNDLQQVDRVALYKGAGPHAALTAAKWPEPYTRSPGRSGGDPVRVRDLIPEALAGLLAGVLAVDE